MHSCLEEWCCRHNAPPLHTHTASPSAINILLISRKHLQQTGGEIEDSDGSLSPPHRLTRAFPVMPLNLEKQRAASVWREYNPAPTQKMPQRVGKCQIPRKQRNLNIGICVRAWSHKSRVTDVRELMAF